MPMLDTRTLAQHGRMAVLAHSHLVMWPDGSTLALHLVRLQTVVAPLLRAVRVEGQWAVLELNRALPALADDIRVAPQRDAQGLVWFTLRGRWASAGACLAWLRPHLQPLHGPAGVALPTRSSTPQDGATAWA